MANPKESNPEAYLNMKPEDMRILLLEKDEQIKNLASQLEGFKSQQLAYLSKRIIPPPGIADN